MPLKCLEQLFGPLMKATGNMKTVLSNTLIYGLILIPSFFIGAQYDGVGIAFAWLVSFGLAFTVATWRSCKALNIDFKKYLRNIYKTHLYGLIMMAICLLLGRYLDSYDAILVLCIQVLLGAAIYIAFVVLFSKEDLKEFYDLFKNRKIK